jgi:dolichol-phosphate mannosyltransferase
MAAADERVLIVIPTYNEAENLPKIIPAAHEVLPQAHVLVVDDGSPDGTGRLADELSARDPRVHVLHRTGKGGLGTAYIAGFRWALARDYAFVFEMDADFSHQPRFLPAFLDKAQQADLVLGARYVPGGGTEGWSWKRELISRGGNAYARAVLGLWRLHDITGGFKCFRREVLAALDLDAIQQKGFGFQIELTYRTVRKGFRVAEVPIVFPDRAEGTSKMSGGIFREALVGVWKLRFGVK